MSGQQDRLAKDDGEFKSFVIKSFVIKAFSMLGEMTKNHAIAFGDEEGADESS
ncbi:MAG: hypothetical protein GY924_09520 [Planctomycetaceae bacterium]|nr:hypothetical protein [Planctomycetaceae bacterium]